MSRVRNWGIAFGLTVAAVVACYFFVDKPLALFIHARLPQFRSFFILVTFIPEPFLVIAALIVGATALYLALAWLFRCHEIEEVYGIATRRTASAGDGYTGS